jgi:hypothetical protein
VLGERPSGLRWHHAASDPYEQIGADDVLELADLTLPQ